MAEMSTAREIAYRTFCCDCWRGPWCSHWVWPQQALRKPTSTALVQQSAVQPHQTAMGAKSKSTHKSSNACSLACLSLPAGGCN